MKIVAVIQEGGYYNQNQVTYMAEVHVSELERISGGQIRERLAVGTEVKVSEAWNDLAAFRAAKGKLDYAAETMRALASLAETASASYIIEPTKKEEVSA